MSESKKDPETRWTVRIRTSVAERFIAACKKCGYSEPDALRALAEAFANRVEKDGGVWIPISVLPPPSNPFPSTATPARQSIASLNEPLTDPAVPHSDAAPETPRLTKTRAALRKVARAHKPAE